MHDIAEAVARIEKIGQQFASKQTISWGVELKDENHLIGDFGFDFWGQSYYKTDLGYSIAPPYWRRGFATEVLRALLRFGFETLGLHRINVDTRMDNIASVRLVEKLGFRNEGVRRECERSEDGSYQNWGLFGMLENEYRLLSLEEEQDGNRDYPQG